MSDTQQARAVKPDSDTGSSSVFTATTSSLLGDGNWLRSRFLPQLYFAGFQALTTAGWRKFEFVAFVLEWAQVFSFSFHGKIFSGGALAAAFAGFCRVRDPVNETFSSVAFAILGALPVVYLLVVLLQAVLISRGRVGLKFGYSLMRLIAVVFRFSALPSVRASFSLMHSYSGTMTIPDWQTYIWLAIRSLPGRILWVGVALAVVNFIAVLHAAFTQQTTFRPTTAPLAVTLSRYSVFMLLAKFALVISDLVAIGADSEQITLRLSLYAASVAAIALLALVAVVCYVPYVSRRANCIAVGFLAGTSAAAVAGIAAGTSASPQWRTSWAIVALALQLVAVPVAVVLFRVRLRYPNFPIPWAGPSTVENAMFRYKFSYDIATRHVYQRRNIAQNELLLAQELLEDGARAFPEDSFIRCLTTVFLLDAMHDTSRVKNQLLLGAREKTPPIDIAYLIYCIGKSFSANAALSGEEEIELGIAEGHHRHARKILVEFWGTLANAKRKPDPETLLELVSDLSTHERAADGIFKRLLSSNLRSTVLLRKYGRFLETVKDDHEQAEMLYQFADAEDTKAAQKEPKARVVVMADENAHALGADVETGVQLETAGVIPGSIIDSESAQGQCRERSESSITSSSIGSIQSSASALNEDRSRTLDYRARIASKSSNALKYVKAVVVCSIFLATSIGIVTYVIASQSVVALANAVALLGAAGTITPNIENMAYILRKMEASRISGASLFPEPLSDMQQWNVSYAGLDSQWSASFMISNQMAAWVTKIVPIVRYHPGANRSDFFSGRSETSMMTLWDAGNALATYMSASSKLMATNDETLEVRPEWRFVLDNTDAVVKGVFALCDEVSSETSAVDEKVLISEYASMSAALLVGTALLMYGAMQALRRERRALGSLFSEVPKSACLNIYDRMAALDTKGGGVTSTSTYALVKKGGLTLRLRTIGGLAVILALLLAVGCAIIVTYVVMSQEMGQADEVLVASVKRSAYLNRIGRAVLELPLHDRTSWSSTSALEAYLSNATDAALAAEDDLKYSLGQLQHVTSAFQQWFTVPCPAILQQVNITCKGISGLITVFTDNAEILARPGQPIEYTWTDNIRTELFVRYVLADWLVEAANDFQTEADTKISLSKDTIDALLGLTIAIAIIGVLSFFPTLNDAGTTARRASELLLVVPMNVIQKTDALRAYLEHGGKVVADSTMKSIAEEQEKRTKMILDACKDAVILFDQSGNIDMVNPAAEELLGYSAEKVLGHPCSIVMSPESSEHYLAAISSVVKDAQKGRKRTFLDATESKFIRKDGQNIPVMTTTAVVISADGITFAMFAKDIRVLKENEAQVEKERHRADILLQNILPTSIIECLKKSPGQVVARTHRSVSILFADIVNFTPLASSMTPYDLVQLLNDLFRPWDDLCDDFCVEKIKTVGDCYMAVCGLDIDRDDHAERILYYAVAALESVEQLNKKLAEQKLAPIALRIGINSGSVVAGVIGSRKWAFDIWGDAVNLASRLESSGQPNRIQVSVQTKELAGPKFQFERRGLVQLKGKGEVDCFWLVNASKRTDKAALSHRSAFGTRASLQDLIKSGVPSPDIGVMPQPSLVPRNNSGIDVAESAVSLLDGSQPSDKSEDEGKKS